MSGPLKLTATQLSDLSDFLGALSEATKETGVRAAAYGSTTVAIAGNTIEISFDEDEQQYIVDDLVGS